MSRYEIRVVSGRGVWQPADASCTELLLDVSGVAGVDDLAAALLNLLEVPIPAVGLDAVISLAVDIDEWMPTSAGWVVRIAGLDSCPDDVARSAADVWPPIIDRWRSRADHSFVAVLECSAERPRVMDALRRENLRLRRSGERPDAVTFIGPVPVYVDGVLDEETSAGAL